MCHQMSSPDGTRDSKSITNAYRHIGYAHRPFLFTMHLSIILSVSFFLNNCIYVTVRFCCFRLVSAVVSPFLSLNNLLLFHLFLRFRIPFYVSISFLPSSRAFYDKIRVTFCSALQFLCSPCQIPLIFSLSLSHPFLHSTRFCDFPGPRP